MRKDAGFTWKLGIFVLVGLLLFVVTIYFVGKQKNLFGSTFHLKVKFKTVSGLKEGNNVRFSGINIGTVDGIELLTDTSVLVDLVIRKEVQQFIKTDAQASIGSDGLMGDKVLTIHPGAASSNAVKNGDVLVSKNAIEMDDVMRSLKTSVDNAGLITGQLAEFTYKMNNGNGTLSKLISDEKLSMSLKNTLVNLETTSSEFAYFTSRLNNGDIGLALDSTMYNIQQSTKGLNENMKAAQNNILLRGYFNKKKKAEQKKANELKKQEAIRLKNELKNKKDTVNKTKPAPVTIIKKDTIPQSN